MTNVDPPDGIPQHKESSFRGRYRDCVHTRLEIFREEVEEGYRETLEDDISNDKRHRELLNLCIFPFVESQLNGYEFIRADPLSELGEPNFDFLLWDFDGHAIFGEAKANVGEGWEGTVVNDVVEQREAVEDNIDYIKRNYVGSDIKNIEYVVAAFSTDADRVAKKILSEREKVVTWSVHQMGKTIDVHSPAPPREDWIEDPDEYYDLIQHTDTALNSALRREDSSTECLDFFPESFPVTELYALISASHKSDNRVLLNVDDLLQTVEENLFYLSPAAQEEKAEDILRLGKEIEYLREWDAPGADYKLISRYTHSDGLERTLSRKWIDYKVEQKKDEIRDDCRDDVKEHILEEIKPQKRLSDYL